MKFFIDIIGTCLAIVMLTLFAGLAYATNHPGVLKTPLNLNLPLLNTFIVAACIFVFYKGPQE